MGKKDLELGLRSVQQELELGLGLSLAKSQKPMCMKDDLHIEGILTGIEFECNIILISNSMLK